MYTMPMVIEICSKFDAIPLLGRCLLCEDTDCRKAALIKNCQIKALAEEYPHKAVLGWLCGMHVNDNDPDLEELREKVENLDLNDWKIV